MSSVISLIIAILWSSLSIWSADVIDMVDPSDELVETTIEMEATTVTEVLDKINRQPSKNQDDDFSLPEIVMTEEEIANQNSDEDRQEKQIKDQNQNGDETVAMEDEARLSDPCCCPALQAILDALGTPKGAAIVGSIYSISLGISSLFWGFDWTKYAGTSDDTRILLQEIGCFSTSAECIFFGVLIPLMLYEYNKNKKANVEDKSDIV